MEDTRFDDMTKAFGTMTTRRLTLGALLGGALARLGLGEADAKKRKGSQRVGDQAVRARRNLISCPVCQRRWNGKCQAVRSGTPCTASTGATGTCLGGVCLVLCSPLSTNCK